MRRNSKRILDLLDGESKGLTRAQIGERTGLSKPTVQSIIAELRAAEHVTEAEDSGSLENSKPAGGRPPARFMLTPAAGLVAGVDLGHGHIRAAVSDRSGRIVGDVTEDISIDVDRAGVSALTKVVALIEEAASTSRHSIATIRAITIGIPAAVDRSGTVLFSDSLPSWATVNIGDELLKLLERRAPDIDIDRGKVRVENDANLGAVGEGWRGAAEGRRHYLYVKVSTGIGMGLVVRGQLYRGAEAAAGEFGHVTVSPMAAPFLRSVEAPVRPCPRCSKLDCLENLASAKAILRQLEHHSQERVTDQQIERVVARATTDAVAYRANLEAIVDAGIRIGYTLADLVRVFAPEVVVIGGLLAEAGETLVKPIRDALAGMRGLPAVEIRAVDRARIRRSEVEGALGIASRIASLP
jgi:predicted NBD/HSP70 family sugar kinase